jgi:predicted RND superfamily exporter protein
MLKKILPLIVLIAGVGFLAARPVVFQEGLQAVMPFSNPEDGFGKYPALERQNNIYVVLSQAQGDVFNPEFFKTLRDVTNDIFYLPDVDRSGVVSLVNINVAYRDVVEDGFEGGPIISEDFAYGQDGYDAIKKNLLKSPYLGQLISYDLKSALIAVPYFSAADGRNLTKAIERILPKNGKIRVSIFGYSPFLVAVQKEMSLSFFYFLFSWFVGCLVFWIMNRRLSFSLVLGPLVAVVLQIILYSFFSRSFHPFVLPVMMLTVIVSFFDRLSSELDVTDEKRIPFWAAGVAIAPALSLYFLGSSLGQQMAYLSFAGGLAVLITHQLFSKSRPESIQGTQRKCEFSTATLSLGLKNILLWGCLCLGLVAASTMMVGHHGSGPTLLRPQTHYQKAQRLVSESFAFTADSMLIPALAKGEGCTDPAVIHRLEMIRWTLAGFPGVRFVSSLSEAVKRINMFFHENNLKWRSIPRERDTLVFAVSNIDPGTGLLDDDGLILPVNVFLENHNPLIIEKVYESIKKIKLSADPLTLQIAGGTAAFEAILNESLTRSAKHILFSLLVVLLAATMFLMPFRQSMMFCFLFSVLLSLTLGFIALTGMGWNLESAGGLVMGSCVSLYLLWLRVRCPALDKKIALLVVSGGLVVAGGLFSGVNLIFTASAITEWMLVLTWLLGFKLFLVEEDLEDPSAKI